MPATASPSRDPLPIDAYVLDVLMPDLVGHDRHPSAFLVYLVLWRRTEGGRRSDVPLSLREIAEAAGLAKRSVQSAIDTLERRRLVQVARESITAVPTYSVAMPWRRETET